MAALLRGAGSTLREVRVSDLRGSRFHGQAVLDNGVVVDARPSDALTLAVLLEAPIFVSATVLEAAAQVGGSTDRPHVDVGSYETASQIADGTREFFGSQSDRDAPG
jgi:bifunctional DNase/RNase